MELDMLNKGLKYCFQVILNENNKVAKAVSSGKKIQLR